MWDHGHGEILYGEEKRFQRLPKKWDEREHLFKLTNCVKKNRLKAQIKEEEYYK